jgi:ABC-2 type transport system permease protein
VTEIRQYGLLLRWEYMRQRQLVAMFVVIQLLVGVGIIYGFAFLVPHMTPTVALYLATGAPTISLILVGLVVVPQEASQDRLTGRQDYLFALPVPRLAPMFADLTFWVLVQIPGAAATVGLAVVRFHVGLAVGPAIVPAVVLVSLTAATVGYALAMSFSPMATQQITQFLSIGLLLFSPIAFPLDRLPSVLRDVHQVLPVFYMAGLMRGSLTGAYGVSVTLAFVVVGGWCMAGLVASGRVAARRR